MIDDLKRKAALAAMDAVRPGMRLGLGTGSTAAHFVRALGMAVREGLSVIGVPTSEATAALPRRKAFRCTSMVAPTSPMVDGADEVDRRLRLIKGGGGRAAQKIVAAASRRLIIVADGSKLSRSAPSRCPQRSPRSMAPRGERSARLLAAWAFRRAALRDGPRGTPFVSDGGNAIMDASFGRIPDPEALAAGLDGVPGVVAHGLFLDLATTAIIARETGIEWLGA
jgi:ribose 5-phosphate isomerase A